MRTWQSPDAQFEHFSEDLPAPVPRPAPPMHYLRALLRRLHSRPAASLTPGVPPAMDDARLERARAALAEARSQMPGLLGEPADAELPSLSGSDEEHRDGSDRLARVEDVARRLEDERRRLGSEVAALHIAVEELREVLARADERWFSSTPALAHLTASPKPAAIRQPVPVPSREMGGRDASRPGAGSHGAAPAAVELRLLGVDEPATVERVRGALAALAGVEAVQAVDISEDEACLRLSLRSPRTDAELIDLLLRAAPAAKPLAGPAAGSLLLRLRPA